MHTLGKQGCFERPEVALRGFNRSTLFELFARPLDLADLSDIYTSHSAELKTDGVEPLFNK